MSQEKEIPTRETPTDEAFEQKLIRLRARIDLLPAEQRPHLYDLADSLSRGYRHLQDRRRSSGSSK
jgi:hypothetical protein